MTPFAAEISRSISRFMTDIISSETIKDVQTLEYALVEYMKKFFFDVETEKKIVLPAVHNKPQSFYADVVVSKKGECVPISLKLHVRDVQNHARSNFWQEINRMNYLIQTVNGVDTGFVILITNKSVMWTEDKDVKSLDDAKYSLNTGNTINEVIRFLKNENSNRPFDSSIMWIESHVQSIRCCMAQQTLQSIGAEKRENAIDYRTLEA